MMRKKIISAFLSFILNGLGQIYNHQIRKGIIFIFISLLCILLIILGIVFLFQSFIFSLKGNFEISLTILGLIFFSLGGFFLCLVSLLSILDAYENAQDNKS
jgi:TM2 domain-containing membrane protein YozV